MRVRQLKTKRYCNTRSKGQGFASWLNCSNIDAGSADDTDTVYQNIVSSAFGIFFKTLGFVLEGVHLLA